MTIATLSSVDSKHSNLSPSGLSSPRIEAAAHIVQVFLQRPVVSAFLGFLGSGLISLRVSISLAALLMCGFFLVFELFIRPQRTQWDGNFSKDSFYLKTENNSPE